jgi:MFS-type transporter involved in bile tolerance (Atg22 family)
MGNYFRKKFGHRGLILFSVGTQSGALIGAFIIFTLTNTFQLFKKRNICDKTSQCF